MLLVSIPYWSIMLFSGVMTALVGFFAFRSLERQSAFELGFVMLTLTIWSGFYAAELVSQKPEMMMLWAKIEYLGITTVPPAWLIFALSLNPWKKLKNKRFSLSLFFIPLVIVAACWTNQWHHLFWISNEIITKNGFVIMENTYGPLFWIHFVYSYLLLISGTIILIYRFIVTEAIYRYRFIYVIIPIIPLLANIIQFIDDQLFGYLDLTPFAFSVSGIMLLWGSTRGFKVDFIPVAREAVMESLDVGIIITSKSGEIINTNSTAMKMTGLYTNNHLQTFFQDYYPETLDSTNTMQYELDNFKENNCILLKTSPIKHGTRVLGKMITLINITKQKQVAFELQESNKRYETIFSGMRDALLVESSDGDILEVNNEACRMYGYTRKELLSKNVRDLAGDNKRLLMNSRQVDSHVEVGFHQDVFETINVRKNGEMFPAEVNGSLLNLSGEDVLLVIVRDITEAKRNEGLIKSRERNLQLLNQMTNSALSRSHSFDVLQSLVESLSELLYANGTYINLWDQGSAQVKPAVAFGMMKDVYSKLNKLSDKDTLTKKALDSNEPIIIDDIFSSNFRSLEVSLIYPARAVIVLPMIVGTQKLGCAFVAYDSVKIFTDEEVRWGMQAADQIALSLSRAYLIEQTQDLLNETQRINETLEQKISLRTEELRTAYDATIEGWARALELREKETAGHSQRTVVMSLQFAERIGFSQEGLEHIRRGALLHDIGKMVIPDAILQKPGALDPDERKIIEEHPLYSKMILEPISFLRLATDIPYYHHERWDGTGYPIGLAGENIPLAARMFAIIDVWDALSSARYYRDALPYSEVYKHIEAGIGSHFDPNLAEIFLEMIQE